MLATEVEWAQALNVTGVVFAALIGIKEAFGPLDEGLAEDMVVRNAEELVEGAYKALVVVGAANP